jgi:hypothetical protein
MVVEIVDDALDDALEVPVELAVPLCVDVALDDADDVALDDTELVCVEDGDVISQLNNSPSRYMLVKLFSAAANSAHVSPGNLWDVGVVAT